MESGYIFMKNISKTFDKKQVLSNVDIKIKLGTIHGILGENGAGKSVLMNILSGSLQCDYGSIFIDGQPVNIRQPADALKLGIITIYQDIFLVSDLSVAENLFLANLPRNPITRKIDWKEAYSKSNDIFKRLNFDIDPRNKVSDLNYTQKRMVEIAKALVNDVKILVLDEASIGLSDYEQKHFLDVLKALNRDGITIIHISHNIDEAMDLCDTFSIMKDGRSVLDFNKGEISKDAIIRAIVGGVLRKNYPRILCDNKRLLLKVENLVTQRGVNNVTFNLYKGEILGIAGLVGSGRTAIAKALFGIEKITNGTIQLNNTPITIKTPADAIKAGFGYLPEDMLKESLNTRFAISENITMANLKDVTDAFIINQEKETKVSMNFIKKLIIKTPSMKEHVTNLSKGNQQKVHLSKWLHANCKVLMLDEPTNGIDIGTRVDIYNYMNNYVLKGNSIILISSNLEELIGMCDRILVLKEGTISCCLNQSEFSKEAIIKAATESN